MMQRRVGETSRFTTIACCRKSFFPRKITFACCRKSFFLRRITFACCRKSFSCAESLLRVIESHFSCAKSLLRVVGSRFSCAISFLRVVDIHFLAYNHYCELTPDILRVSYFSFFFDDGSVCKVFTRFLTSFETLKFL